MRFANRAPGKASGRGSPSAALTASLALMEKSVTPQVIAKIHDPYVVIYMHERYVSGMSDINMFVCKIRVG